MGRVISNRVKVFLDIYDINRENFVFKPTHFILSYISVIIDVGWYCNYHFKHPTHTISILLMLTTEATGAKGDSEVLIQNGYLTVSKLKKKYFVSFISVLNVVFHWY